MYDESGVGESNSLLLNRLDEKCIKQKIVVVLSFVLFCDSYPPLSGGVGKGLRAV